MEWLEELLRVYDFEKCRQMMILSGHTWFPEGVPTVEQMKFRVRDLFHTLFHEHKGDGSMGCGGFTVYFRGEKAFVKFQTTYEASFSAPLEIHNESQGLLGEDGKIQKAESQAPAQELSSSGNNS
jgi:hypothetical protein